GIQ
ncbi:DNA ligase, partial [Haemophilus influenzae]